MVNPVGPLHPAAPRPVSSEAASSRPASEPTASRPATEPTAPRSAPAPAAELRSAEPVAEAAETRESTLWDLLSPEEREVYARYSGAGALTYRADGNRGGEPPVSTGRRIDLKG
jgi:hypothetical protein